MGRRKVSSTRGGIKNGGKIKKRGKCKELGIDPYSEKAAYLSGQLAKKLFKAQLRNWIR